MKISKGWKVILYIFAVIVFIQSLDLSFYLMNRKDSLLANLGIVTLSVTLAAVVYCLIAVMGLGLQFIEELEEKEGKK